MVGTPPFLWIAGALLAATSDSAGAWLAQEAETPTPKSQILSQAGELNKLRAVGKHKRARVRKAVDLLTVHHGSHVPATMSLQNQKWERRHCNVVMTYMQVRCTKCHGWWEQCNRAKSRSQSQRKRRATVFQQELELFEEGRRQAIRTPGVYAAFICEVGWTGTTMAEVNTRRKAGKGPGRGDSRTPTATTIATTSQTGRRAQEVAPEARAHIESLQKSMGSAFMPKLEQDIVAVARASPKAPKLEITHKQARHQYDAAKTHLKEVDGKWVQFNQGLQLAYNLEYEDYRKKREAAIEEVKVKKQKLVDIQERVRTFALQQRAGGRRPKRCRGAGAQVHRACRSRIGRRAHEGCGDGTSQTDIWSGPELTDSAGRPSAIGGIQKKVTPEVATGR